MPDRGGRALDSCFAMIVGERFSGSPELDDERQLEWTKRMEGGSSAREAMIEREVEVTYSARRPGIPAASSMLSDGANGRGGHSSRIAAAVGLEPVNVCGPASVGVTPPDPHHYHQIVLE